jgi:hypothetical protein
MAVAVVAHCSPVACRVINDSEPTDPREEAMHKVGILVGLLAELFGLLCYSWGEVRAAWATLRPRNASEAHALASEVRREPWWRKWPLQFAVHVGARDVLGTASVLYESYPLKYWGLCLLALGVLLHVCILLWTL